MWSLEESSLESVLRKGPRSSTDSAPYVPRGRSDVVVLRLHEKRAGCVTAAQRPRRRPSNAALHLCERWVRRVAEVSALAVTKTFSSVRTAPELLARPLPFPVVRRSRAGMTRVMRTIAAGLLALMTTACGPKVSQWIVVRDCNPPHAPIQGARVYVQEIYVEGTRERPYALGDPAKGGDTNAEGRTWDVFSARRRSVAHAVINHTPNGKPVISEAERQPTTQVPPEPSQEINVCAYRVIPEAKAAPR